MPIAINGNGTLTGISAGGYPDGSVTAADMASTLDLTGKTVTLPSGTGGKILQVVQTVKSDTDSTSSTTFTDITGFSATITPSSTSSKILVQVVIGTFGNSNGSRGSNYQLVRGSTAIALGDNAAGGQTSFTLYTDNTSYPDGGGQFTYLDSPSTTSATTYKVQWMTYSNTVYINRGSYATDTGSWNRRGSSQIILMEVAG